MQLRTGKIVSSINLNPIENDESIDEMRTKIKNLESQILELKNANETNKYKKNPVHIELKHLMDEYTKINGSPCLYDRRQRLLAILAIYQHYYKHYKFFLDESCAYYYKPLILETIKKSKELKEEIEQKLQDETDELYVKNLYKCYYYIDVVLRKFETVTF